MKSWNNVITLLKETADPRQAPYIKHLSPSQLAAMALIKHLPSITQEDIYRYKRKIDSARKKEQTQLPLSLKILCLDDLLHWELTRHMYHTTCVALALAKLLEYIALLPDSEQEVYLNSLEEEYADYVDTLNPRETPTNFPTYLGPTPQQSDLPQQSAPVFLPFSPQGLTLTQAAETIKTLDTPQDYTPK